MLNILIWFGFSANFNELHFNLMFCSVRFCHCHDAHVRWPVPAIRCFRLFAADRLPLSSRFSHLPFFASAFLPFFWKWVANRAAKVLYGASNTDATLEFLDSILTFEARLSAFGVNLVPGSVPTPYQHCEKWMKVLRQTAIDRNVTDVVHRQHYPTII